MWIIGDSNRSIETFLELLGEHGIQVLMYVRSFPTSKIEQFKKEQMDLLIWFLNFLKLHAYHLLVVEFASEDFRS